MIAGADVGAVKGFRRGTHRLVGPEQTWRVIEPLLDEFGITRIADVTDLDNVGIPVYVAIRPAAATLSVTQGKGVTHELARVSAAMENIELAHAEQVLPATARGPASEVLDGDYDLRDLQLISGSLVSDSVVLDWLPARTLVTGHDTYVPRDYVQFSDVFQPRWAPPLFNTSTNGLASGNSPDEATLHGLYELIERDCMADLSQVPRDQQVRVAPEAITDSDCQWLIERLQAAANWFEIVDATNRFGIPCYHVFIWSPSFPLLVAGSGCHLDPSVAINRALTEAAQARLTIISGTRESVPEQAYLLQHMRQDRPAPLGGDVPVTTCLGPDLSSESITADLLVVAAQVASVTGAEPLVVDIGRGHEGIAVTKSIAPGLSFDPAHHTTGRVRQG